MSVYTKYLEYNLPESNFLVWYEFNDQTDSGPNGNDFTLIEEGGGVFLFGGKANFDDSYITIGNVAPDSFTSFFDFRPPDKKMVISGTTSPDLNGVVIRCPEPNDDSEYTETAQNVADIGYSGAAVYYNIAGGYWIIQEIISGSGSLAHWKSSENITEAPTPDLVLTWTPYLGATGSVAITKQQLTKGNIILSNNTSGSQGFFLGYTENGSFFLHCISEGRYYTDFFNSIKVPRASVLMFSRSENDFILSSYHPISRTFESESIFIPSSFDLGTGDLSLGMWDDVSAKTSDFNSSKMIISEFVVVDVGIQGSIAKLLCHEVFSASNLNREDFSFRSVAVNRRLGPFKLQRSKGNLEKDTGILLPFSIAESGFSLLTNTPSGNARYFVNGEEETPSLFGTYIKFTSQSLSDQVVFDNFSNVVSLESPVPLDSHATGLFAKNSAIISGSGTRVIENQFTFDTNNLCYNSEIIFKNNPNLVEI